MDNERNKFGIKEFDHQVVLAESNPALMFNGHCGTCAALALPAQIPSSWYGSGSGSGNDNGTLGHTERLL